MYRCPVVFTLLLLAAAVSCSFGAAEDHECGQSVSVVLFGATGSLAKKYLWQVREENRCHVVTAASLVGLSCHPCGPYTSPFLLPT